MPCPLRTDYRHGVRVTIEISIGELIDRITILKLKSRRLSGAGREAVRRELAGAAAVRDAAVAPSAGLRALTRQLAFRAPRLHDPLA